MLTRDDVRFSYYAIFRSNKDSIIAETYVVTVWTFSRCNYCSYECGKCRAGTRRLNLNKYCKRDYAILGKIVERETVQEMVKFSMNIATVYKRARDSRLRRGNTYLWVHIKDLACKCPKIKTNKSYLILGKEKEGEQPGLTMTQRSIVIEWKDEWHNRMRRFQRRSRQCK